MSFITSLKQSVFNKQLKRALAGRPAISVPKQVHPSSAKSLAILFVADDANERKLVEQLKTERNKRGQKTQLLGFFSSKVSKEASYNFPFYSIQNLSWAGVPKGAEIDNFLAESCDLLYVLGEATLAHLHFIGQVKKANLRVGPFTYESDSENFYHVQYSISKSSGVKNKLNQINRLFNIINAKETATV